MSDAQKTAKGVREAPAASEGYPNLGTALACLEIALRSAKNESWRDACQQAEAAVEILREELNA